MFLKRKECNDSIYISNSNGTIREIIETIDNGGLKIAIILSVENKLLGVINDGDIRRGLLKGLTLDSPFFNIIRKDCIVIKEKKSKRELLKIMKDNAISQIPVVSKENEFIGLEVSEEILPNTRFDKANFALLMAGGKGTRLSPITDNCPKPLLPINGKPILEIILEQCIDSGINNFYISVHYLAEKIINYFGDGSKWDVQINYIREDIPLGTAGALTLLPKKLLEPIIVINGDVLTKINYADLINYHLYNQADITICAREHILSSPYGVIEVDGICFKSMVEKPSFTQLVNAGIYVINPLIIDSIKKNKYVDMPNFISSAKNKSNKIIVYPVHEYWLDVGKPETLNKALYDWGGNV